MTEDDLRALVREVVARHLGDATSVAGSTVTPGPVSASAPARRPAHAPLPPPLLPATGSDWRLHPSHVRLSLLTGLEQDGPCLVEPVVSCSHCGFCQSWGH